MTNRRSFLVSTCLTAVAPLAGSKSFSAGRSKKTYKAAVIGRTGGGDYGHGLDTIFKGLENVETVAVADAHPDGLKKAAERSGAKKSYLDFHEMLDKERPDLVSIASRQPDCHRDMALAAIDTGAHLYMEKPISEFPKDADDMLNAANAKGLFIAVAHTRRFTDHFLLMKQALNDGILGDILDVRFQGKQDRRVGGEDLIVLGSHDMDIMRFFFGDPQWCFAAVTANGQDISGSSVRTGSEPYTVAGDTIRAEYRFSNNLQCRWTSVKAGKEWNRNYERNGKRINKWGFDIFGSKRILSHQESIGMFVSDFPFISAGNEDVKWKPIQELVTYEKPPRLSHPIRDLIYAIETGGKPQCSGEDARWAIEMICATYLSQRVKGRIDFPLQERGHPLGLF